MVLMSAHRGGQQITNLMSEKGLFGRDRLPQVKAEAAKMVAEGRGGELMLLPGWWWVVSAECVLDYASNMPDTLQNARKIKTPVLYLCGDQEPPDLYPLEKFAQICTSPCETHILPNCDHFYTGHEVAVARLVTDWLVKTCGLSK